jgi:N-sulfoglucosamine sulfohydrolase
MSCARRTCTPCRSALLSGQYFWRTGRGAILQGAVWDASIPSYPLLLKEAGYHIGKTYKVWSPGTPAMRPYGGQQYAYEKAGGGSISSRRTPRGWWPTGCRSRRQAGAVRRGAGNFEAFLADREPGQPFCYWFGPTNVHRKWIKGSGKALWGIDPDDLKGKMPPFCRTCRGARRPGRLLRRGAGVRCRLGVLVDELEEAASWTTR